MSGHEPHPTVVPSSGDEARVVASKRARRRNVLKGVLVVFLVLTAWALAGPDRIVTQDDKDVLDAVLASTGPKGQWYPSEQPCDIREIKDMYDLAIPNDVKPLLYFRNRLPVDPRAFRGAKKLVFLDKAAVDASFEKDFWDGFHAAFPGVQGYVSFSLPVYFDSGRRAIITVGWQAGGLYGEGAVFTLVKTGGVWTVIHQDSTWVS